MKMAKGSSIQHALDGPDLAALSSKESELAEEEAHIAAEEARIRAEELETGSRRHALRTLGEWVDERERALVERAAGLGLKAAATVEGLGQGSALDEAGGRSLLQRSVSLDLQREQHLLERTRVLETRRQLLGRRKAELAELAEALGGIEARLEAREAQVGEAFRKLLLSASGRMPALSQQVGQIAPVADHAPPAPGGVDRNTRPTLNQSESGSFASVGHRSRKVETIPDSPVARHGLDKAMSALSNVPVLPDAVGPEAEPEAEPDASPATPRRRATQPTPVAAVLSALRESEAAEGREREDPTARFDLNKILFANASRKGASNGRGAHAKEHPPELRADGQPLALDRITLAADEDECFISQERPGAEGTEVNLELKSADGKVQRARGLVLWVRARTTSEGPSGVRVRLLNLSDETRAALRTLASSRKG